MGERTEHEHGTFSWADLSTDDFEGAKRFYGGLFGWDFDDVPTGDDDDAMLYAIQTQAVLFLLAALGVAFLAPPRGTRLLLLALAALLAARNLPIVLRAPYAFMPVAP